MRAKPEYYRDQAKRCRRLANIVLGDAERRVLLGVADQFDRLAEEEERCNSNSA